MTQMVTATRRTTRQRSLRNAATLVGAVVAGLAVWVVSVPVAGVDLTVGSGPSAQTVGPLSVALTAALAGGVGWALLALLGGQLRDGRRTWRIIAGLVLAVSLLGPVSMGAAGAVLVSLIAMHLAVGGTLILGLTASGKPAKDR